MKCNQLVISNDLEQYKIRIKLAIRWKQGVWLVGEGESQQRGIIIKKIYNNQKMLTEA